MNRTSSRGRSCRISFLPLPFLALLALTSCAVAGHRSVAAIRRSPDVVFRPITAALLRHESRRRHALDTPAPNPALLREIRNYTYRVGPHDSLSVIVWVGTSGAALLSYTFPVHANGTIHMPWIGTVRVTGLTAGEIRKRLLKRLSAIFHNPQVSVRVVGFRSKFYELAGAVVRPGLYAITNVPLTVSQAIVQAGGVLRTGSSILVTKEGKVSRSLADLRRVVFINHGRRSVLDLEAFYRNGNLSQDRLVRPGDIIRVPGNAREQVHVIGAVARPGNYPMDSGRLNLAEALGDAGGVRFAGSSPARILVFRWSHGRPRIYWLDARSPLALLLADKFELRPQDIVYVTTSSADAWRHVLRRILPSLETLHQKKERTHG